MTAIEPASAVDWGAVATADHVLDTPPSVAENSAVGPPLPVSVTTITKDELFFAKSDPVPRRIVWALLGAYSL
jgi:hypothetical protein